MDKSRVSNNFQKVIADLPLIKIWLKEEKKKGSHVTVVQTVHRHMHHHENRDRLDFSYFGYQIMKESGTRESRMHHQFTF